MPGRTALLLVCLITTAGGPAARAAEAPDPLAKAPSRFAKLGDLRVHYKSLGEGKTALVFVHGWTCDLRAWRYQVPAFEGKVRVVLIDLPGHGQSDKPKIDYTMDLFARAVDAVLRDAGVEKAVVAGHSMGTPVARQFYRLYPEKTAALVAVDGALRPWIKPEQVDEFVGQFTGPDFKGTVGKFAGMMITPQTPEAAGRLIREMMPSAPQHVAVSAMRGMLDPAVWKEDGIKVPVLAVMARNPHWTAEYEKAVHRLAPRLDYRTVEGAGHFVMMDKPGEVNAILADFLKKQGLLNEGR
jgi:pimeloyl-ACP methyl ester carboxylesterase